MLVVRVTAALRFVCCSGAWDGHVEGGQAVQAVAEGLRVVDGGHQPQQEGANFFFFIVVFFVVVVVVRAFVFCYACSLLRHKSPRNEWVLNSVFHRIFIHTTAVGVPVVVIMQ